MDNKQSTAVTTAQGRTVDVTSIEASVLSRYGTGATVTEIASERSRSIKTVSAQLARLQDKLDCQSRGQLRVLAARWLSSQQGA